MSYAPVVRKTASSVNSTTSALNTGFTFTGTAELVTHYSMVKIAIKGDQTVTLTVQFSKDGSTNWEAQAPTMTCLLDTQYYLDFKVWDAYMRVQVSNNSGSNQTYLRLSTHLCVADAREHQAQQRNTLGMSDLAIPNDADAHVYVNARGALYTAPPYDAEMNALAHVSHFGALKTSGTYPVLRANFPGAAIDTTVWTETTANGGGVAVTAGLANMSTSTHAAGSAKLVSVEQGIFEAGQVTVFQSGVKAAAPLANLVQRWGLITANEQDGLYFEMDGTTFKVVALCAGVATEVSRASFNGDTTFTPSAVNNTYRIHYSAGRAIFQRASDGRGVTVHTMVDSAAPLTADLDLGIYYYIANTGSTTDSTLAVRGASSSVFGNLPTVRANETITDAAVMNLTKTVLTTRDQSGTYHNITGNTGGALLVSDFFTEVARGSISNYIAYQVHGNNTNINSGQTEDITEYGGDYTGQPAVDPSETVTVVSSSAADANPAGSGMRTVKITGLKTASSTAVETETIALNGTTGVESASNWYRVFKAEGVVYGASGTNAGLITINHTTTTSNVFAHILATAGCSHTGAFTTPVGTTAYLTSLTLAMARTGGNSGSARVTIQTKQKNRAGHGDVLQELVVTNHFLVNPTYNFPLELKDDVKFRVTDVSDNGTELSIYAEIMYVTT